MSEPETSTMWESDRLKQLPQEELVRIIMQQQLLIQQLQQEIERLKGKHLADSQTSSKPPSIDLLKKLEQRKERSASAEGESKRQSGGQPEHAGKTRKGFGRVDRYEILRPEVCPHCGSGSFVEPPVSVQQQVARLVERPIEVVEYQRQSCQCTRCGQVVAALNPNYKSDRTTIPE